MFCKATLGEDAEGGFVFLGAGKAGGLIFLGFVVGCMACLS